MAIPTLLAFFALFVIAFAIGVLIGLLVWWLQYDRPLYGLGFIQSIKRAFRD